MTSEPRESRGKRRDEAHSRPRICIVDDDDAVRAALTLLVRSCGWDALEFPSAEAFLDADEAGEASCLVLDLQMPGMTGLELHQHLVASGVDIPVIVVTAYPEHPSATRARAAGVRAVLSKPFRDAELLDLIETVVSNPG